MSEDQLKAFLEKVKSDTNIQEKLKAANARHQTEAAIEIAKEAGFAITAEDFQSMQSAPDRDSELEGVSDSELEGAAGGRGCPMCGRTPTLPQLNSVSCRGPHTSIPQSDNRC